MSAPPPPPGSFGPTQQPPPGQPPQGPPQGAFQPQGGSYVPPAAPAPGAPQGQWHGQPAQGAPSAPASSGVTLVWLLAAASVIAVVAGLSIEENGVNAWDTVNAWGGLAIAGAVLSGAGAFGPALGIAPLRAAQLAIVGAGLLVLFWVLLVLPGVGSNTSLVTTIGVLAGVGAAWQAQEAQGPGQPRSSTPNGPGGHSW